jgi:cyclopropane fatty-acyl-phospholipid synthase-like methyltransferase
MIHHLPIYSRYFQKGSTVLDIGCGAGPMSLFAASRGGVVKGVDLSEKAIAENRKAAVFHELENLTFECENFLDYADEAQYDVIMMTEVLEHLADDRGALEKIYQLLNTGGHLLMSVPSANAPLHRRYMKTHGKDHFDERVGHLRRYRPADILNLVCHSGFNLIEFKLCEGYLRNWLFNDRVGQLFMRFNVGPMKYLVTFVDDKFFTPLFGESDIILVAQKA